LRRKHGIDCTQPTNVWAVFSEEPPIAPHPLAYDDGSFRCVCPGGHNGVNDCEHKHRVEGSAAFVPSVFGATCASVAVKLLLGMPLPKPLDPDAPRPRRPDRRATTVPPS
jgi:tRNA A37 threonylcarbamoyladenosine dehydratase